MAETSLGDEIRRARQRKRMTQQKLADLVGVNRSSIGNWETGQHFPQRYAGVIEEVLGITIKQPESAAS